MPQDTPSRKLEQYIVRFPDGMRDRLKEEAAKNNRSLNAEIISRLSASFGPFSGTMVATESGHDGFHGEGFGGLGSPGPARPRIRSLLEMTPDELDTFLADRLAPKIDEIIDNSVDAAVKRHSNVGKSPIQNLLFPLDDDDPPPTDQPEKRRVGPKKKT